MSCKSIYKLKKTQTTAVKIVRGKDDFVITADNFYKIEPRKSRHGTIKIKALEKILPKASYF